MAKYSIGIDLGTSNCAMAFLPLENRVGLSSIVPIPQNEGPESLVELSTLPSFLYFPILDHVKETTGDDQPTIPSGSRHVVGLWARNQSGNLPGHTISSAKSWLCHAGVDRESAFLPWQSTEIDAANKISPVTASAAYLNYLKNVWDQKMAGDDPSNQFDKQRIIVTVPASFDIIAQKLTLQAAQMAGFPNSMRLLEEPQAAFYYWLEKHADGQEINRLLNEAEDGSITVLVCDVGGGTSDFSLFEVSKSPDKDSPPLIRRIAVSDHILLGGDNIDLTLAHYIESRIEHTEKRLNLRQWSGLVADCRRLKEKVYEESGRSDKISEDSFTINIAGTGSSLFGGIISTQIKRSDIESIILDGFFPVCDSTARAEKDKGGLREIGLPYAQDTGITRHLAEFLNGREVDVILFNGGTLKPESLQARLQATITDWQAKRIPLRFHNSEADLAVAHGAARYGWYVEQNINRIESGSSHSIYLEVARKKALKQRKMTQLKENTQLVCILPQGTPLETPVNVSQLNLQMLINQPVRFKPFYSNRRGQDRPGQILERNALDFHPLPDLQTVIQIEPGKSRPANDLLKVNLESRLNAIGILQVECVGNDRTAGPESRWQLDFNLRIGDSSCNPEAADQSTAMDTEEPNTKAKYLDLALRHIQGFYAKKANLLDSGAKIKKLTADCENWLKVERREWNPALLRALWEPLQDGITRRNRSVDHEAAWLSLAGFVLRPGFGFPFDEFRINSLWRLQELGLSFPRENRVRDQYWILWRRCAGGLDAERQQIILKKWMNILRQPKEKPYELVRMAGSMERLPLKTRQEMLGIFIKRVLREEKVKGYCEPWLWAIGRILSRIPLYAGMNSVLPPKSVEDAFKKLKKLDWGRKNLNYLNTAFSQAARLTGDRAHDLDDYLLTEIYEKMNQSGAPEEQLVQLKEVMPIEGKDRNRLFGESLPPGLVL